MTLFNQKRIAYVFIAPQIIITLLFFVWPAINALIQSFYYTDAFGLQHRYAGLQNFSDLLHSNHYLKAIEVTIVLCVSVSLFTMAIGLLLAYLVNKRSQSQFFYKTIFLWPYAVAPAVGAILWRFLCHPILGWMTHILNYFHIKFNYLTSATDAMILVIIAATWQQFSYNFLFYFAAIKLIPRHLEEAAILDGASPWRMFWQIIFPLLSPTTFFLLTMNIIYSFFDTFGLIQVITNGGPENATTTLMFKVYQDGFAGFDLGSSYAQSIILMLIVTGLTILQFKVIEKKVHYQ